METAKALVEERRRKAAEDAKRAQEARIAKAKADLEAEKREGLRIIYADYTDAMRKGNFEKIYQLIDNYGADVNWEDTYGNNPLITACRYGLKVPIQRLIERGADADHENKFGMTPGPPPIPLTTLETPTVAFNADTSFEFTSHRIKT